MSDDPLEHVAGTMMMTGGAFIQGGQGVLQALSEAHRRRTEQSEQDARAARERVAAQLVLAEQRIQQFTDPQWWEHASPAEQGEAWQATQVWRQVSEQAGDPARATRFEGYQNEIRDRVQERYGSDLSRYLSGETLDGADQERVGGDLIELYARRAQEKELQPAQAAVNGADQEQDLDQSRADQDVRNADGHFRDGDVDQGRADLAAADRDGAEAVQDKDQGVDAGRVPESREPDSWDSPGRRIADENAMRESGVDEESIRAKMISDRGNGADPRRAAGAGTGRAAGARTGATRALQRAEERTR